MQSKGAIKFVAIIIALACLYQLSFTWATSHQESKAAKYAAAAVEAERTSPSFASVPDVDKAYFLDSLAKVKNRLYIDSVSNEKVFLGFTYKQIKEKEINLGLDLKGGMNVMLQVQLKDLIKALADNNRSSEFQAALDLAQEKELTSREDFITLFQQSWEEVAPAKRMSSVFGTYEMRDRIKPETSNNEVIAVIRNEAESAIANSFNVLRNRIDRFGVTQPNIQKIGNTGRILVELPGVKEPERVRKLLQGTASLEFWPTFDNSEVYVYLEEANRTLKDILPSQETTADNGATEKSAEDSLENDILAADSLSADDQAWIKNNPLFALLSPNVYGNQLAPGACIGHAHYKDTATINRYLNMPQIKAILPSELVPMWSVKPDATGIYYDLVAIKVNTRDGKAPLDGGMVSNASVAYNNAQGGSPEVDMTMNAEGARIWARLTADNIGKSIAIVLDGMVYSYPNVRQEISGGRSQISGNFTITEAEDLANVLQSGKLPAPATIVQEQVVGPSLGSASINAGLISFLIAFVLVLIYILIFYQGAGVAANIALLCNVLFLLGALASFGAVLTLPGIAGLILTLGMAVDSNVIIYERVKEELRAGKPLKTAIKEGYSNAYSAIVDGNLTTIITGIILYIFGSGPVQGFATTLVIGIITSMLTSIFITRLIFEARLSRKGNISFDNGFSRNFLANTKYNFLGVKKITYTVSIAVIAICIGSMAIKGFTYGVDFTGGRTYVLRFDQDISVEQIRSAANDEFGESVEVKQFGGESQVKLTTKYKVEDNSTEVDQEIEQMLFNAMKPFYKDDITLFEFTSTMENPNGIISSDKVGPTIANDIKRDAIIAVLLSLLAIFAYIAFRFKNWRWGLSGVVGLTHDALIVIGFFSLFTGILPFSLDVDQTFIAAVLTIIGYSINNTVVIFDRIREYRTLYPKRDLGENVNGALNSTLARTVNTTMTTLVVMLAISLFGGEVIRGLAVALIVGILVGAYSSVFISTPVMYDLNILNKKEDKTSKTKR